MMKRGKLVWHRSSLRAWTVESHIDEHVIYRVQRRNDKTWEVSTCTHFTDGEWAMIGRASMLSAAKRIADRRHHTAILASDDTDLKAYVKRYPL